MSILYFTYSTVCSPTSSVSHCVNYYLNAYQYYYTMVLILIIIIFIIIKIYLLTNTIAMLIIPMQHALSPFQLPCLSIQMCMSN